MKIFSTQVREENTIKQSTKRTTSTTREETCLFLRSVIGDCPSVFVPQGNRAKAQDQAEEHRTGDKGGEIKQRSGGGEKTRSLAANRSRIRNRIAQSTEPKTTRAHSWKKPLTGFLLSRVPRNAGLSKLLSRFKMGRR